MARLANSLRVWMVSAHTEIAGKIKGQLCRLLR